MIAARPDDECPVCGARDAAAAAELAQATVVDCRHCGLVRCAPLPTIASASAGASSILTEEAFTAGLLTVSPAQAARYAILARARHARYARDLGRTRFRVLEIGCGAAGLAEELTRLGVDYHGLDLDPRPIAAARQRGVANLRVGDFFELPDEAPFDVITASQVLEHVIRPRAFVEKIARWLTPGGLVHLDVPSHRALAGWPSRAARGLGARFGAIAWPHHALAYRATTLRPLLAPYFTIDTFTAAPDHTPWGQATVGSPAARAYYAASRLLGAPSLAVAYGRKR